MIIKLKYNKKIHIQIYFNILFYNILFNKFYLKTKKEIKHKLIIY